MNYENTAAGAARGLGGISDMLFRLDAQRKAEEKEAMRDALARKKEEEDKLRAAQILEERKAKIARRNATAKGLMEEGMPLASALATANVMEDYAQEDIGNLLKYSDMPESRKHEGDLLERKETAETGRLNTKLTATASENQKDREAKSQNLKDSLANAYKIQELRNQAPRGNTNIFGFGLGGNGNQQQFSAEAILAYLDKNIADAEAQVKAIDPISAILDKGVSMASARKQLENAQNERAKFLLSNPGLAVYAGQRLLDSTAGADTTAGY
jgi:hypothetical protein